MSNPIESTETPMSQVTESESRSEPIPSLLLAVIFFTPALVYLVTPGYIMTPPPPLKLCPSDYIVLITMTIGFVSLLTFRVKHITRFLLYSIFLMINVPFVCFMMMS